MAKQILPNYRVAEFVDGNGKRWWSIQKLVRHWFGKPTYRDIQGCDDFLGMKHDREYHHIPCKYDKDNDEYLCVHHATREAAETAMEAMIASLENARRSRIIRCVTDEESP